MCSIPATCDVLARMLRRGSLLSDPRYDAVRAIILTAQDDDEDVPDGLFHTCVLLFDPPPAPSGPALDQHPQPAGLSVKPHNQHPQLLAGSACSAQQPQPSLSGAGVPNQQSSAAGGRVSNHQQHMHPAAPSGPPTVLDSAAMQTAVPPPSHTNHLRHANGAANTGVATTSGVAGRQPDCGSAASTTTFGSEPGRLDGLGDVHVDVFDSERRLLEAFAEALLALDPDIVVGFEVITLAQLM